MPCSADAGLARACAWVPGLLAGPAGRLRTAGREGARHRSARRCPCLERALVWEIWDVAQIDPLADGMIGEWLTLPQVADRLGVSISRVRQLFRDRKLLAGQGPEGKLCVPAGLLDGNQVVRGLHGTLTLPLDCGFDDADALRWLFTPDASLPGTPIQAISENRRTEVNRRAQALAFCALTGRRRSVAGDAGAW